MSSNSGFAGDRNPLTLLRRRSSLIVNDLSSAEVKLMGASKTPARAAVPTTFDEPDASSLLDSFGF